MRISFIVVTWNSAGWIGDCLKSIQAQRSEDDEVLVVDNASTDGTPDLVSRGFPGVRLIRQAENLGFTGGNNAALEEARGAYAALVNSDAALQPGWTDRMLAAMETDPRVGICASRILKWPGPEEGGGPAVLDAAGDGITSAFTPFKRGHGLPDASGPGPGRAFGASAAAALYRTAMLAEIGAFDPDFFLLHEDSDLNFRANLAGWRCVYVPEAAALHRVSAHLDRLPDLTIYHHQRNLEWLWIKNAPFWWAVRHLPTRMAYEAFAWAYYCLRLGRWRVYLRAKRDALRGLPRMWARRREIQSGRRLSYREFSALMTSYFSAEILSDRARKVLRPPAVFRD